ncbi:nucleotidyltransferase domain-containing protein [Kribbella sp. HUAS MG21]|uniref:Nucleotidyltransferase domain-containing protein n=1 Tax=Kribbella sp. HUAS MG21 TaxID=3160966 RepID=A0AAU7TAB7_9ACTN
MDATQASRWRRAAVQPVLDRYAAAEGVDAVMLGGSTARGDADRWSDVEIGVFWRRLPTTAERLAVPEAVEVQPGTAATEPVYDELYLGAPRPDGLLVEVAHLRTQTVEAMLDDVLAGNPDGPGMTLLKGLVDGRDVSGPHPEIVTGWQQRVATYPRELALAVVRRDGNIVKFWRLQMLVERDNPFLLAREFMRITNQLLNVLHALNGRYCGHVTAFKRLDALERDLPVAPARLADRLRAVFAEPAPDGARTLRELVEETYDLVERELPEVDVDLLRANFRSDRRPLDSPH